MRTVTGGSGYSAVSCSSGSSGLCPAAGAGQRSSTGHCVAGGQQQRMPPWLSVANHGWRLAIAAEVPMQHHVACGGQMKHQQSATSEANGLFRTHAAAPAKETCSRGLRRLHGKGAGPLTHASSCNGGIIHSSGLCSWAVGAEAVRVAGSSPRHAWPRAACVQAGSSGWALAAARQGTCQQLHPMQLGVHISCLGCWHVVLADASAQPGQAWLCLGSTSRFMTDVLSMLLLLRCAYLTKRIMLCFSNVQLHHM